ncbi:hypothetical protein [Pseudoclavibacter helvolus]|uniref:hypothetical protein n=1 Tax=Pseudoclavibacter helvolus TaxID=255205 RepID=UPI003C70E80D
MSIVRRFQPRELIAAARDAVTAQGSRPHIVTVEAAGAVSTGVLRDALGWARELASAGGRELKPRSGSVLLESPDGVPVVVTWLGAAQVPWLRVCALGAVEVEVEVDEGTGCASVVTRSGAGEHVVRAGFEEPARRELRRAIDAARASVWPDELTPFLADLRLQASIVAPAGASTTPHAPVTDNL